MIVSPALRLKLDSAALVANWRWLDGRSGAASCGAAIKSDGYGLGARAVLDRLAAAGCRDFFVATWDEAARLGTLPAGISLSVLHGVRAADMADALALGARPVLNSLEQVARWKQGAPGRPCDLMVDTGMNRLGLSVDELGSGLFEGLAIETLASHLACADEPPHGLNEIQLARFEALRASVPAQRHSLANSGGICLGPRYAFDLTRPGLALYGGIPHPAAEGAIRQVVRPEAEILQVRTVHAGDTVGYGATFIAPAKMRLAILNIGYADGYLRVMAGKGRAFAGDAALPLVGRVSMDLIAVDAGDADLRAGDWLEIDYDLPSLSVSTGLSQYELLTGMGSRYQRCWL